MNLLTRAKAIRLPLREIAKRTRLDHHTIRRIDNPNRSPLATTKDAIGAVIVAEEISLRDYLIDLHGLPERDAFVVGGTARRVVKPTVERVA